MKKRTRSILSALVVVIVASLAVASVADAHFLSSRLAKKGARVVAKSWAQEFANQGDQDVAYGIGKCSQRTAHKWVCRFYVQGIDDNGRYLCRGYAIVRFVSANSNQIVAKSQSRRLACVR